MSVYRMALLVTLHFSMLPFHMGITLVYHVLFVKIADYTIVILKLAKSALLYCEIVQQD